jgi:hypothetical protein
MQNEINLGAKIVQMKLGGLKSSNYETLGVKIKQLKRGGGQNRTIVKFRGPKLYLSLIIITVLFSTPCKISFMELRLLYVTISGLLNLMFD